MTITRRVATFHPAVGQLWETTAAAVLAVKMRLHTWMFRACCVIPCYTAVGGGGFLRRKERSLQFSIKNSSKDKMVFHPSLSSFPG